jgi:hypothetical protein
MKSITYHRAYSSKATMPKLTRPRSGKIARRWESSYPKRREPIADRALDIVTIIKRRVAL